MGRRTENTEYLKECIADALLQHMVELPIEKITIEQITSTAGVGRTTYFRYFNSKLDVLSFKVGLQWRRWQEEHPLQGKASERERALQFFSFCQSRQTLLRFLYEKGEIQLIMDSFLRGIALSTSDPGRDQYREMYTHCGVVGVMMVWIGNGFRETPEALADICASREEP